ncbi:FABL018Cp [Eremothecium gossypii FDAG1]|nr:FABL018Cp [Eremothecium gossypii FDAG1]
MKSASVIVGEPAGPHETAPRRNSKCPDAVVERPLGFSCNTVYEFALEAMERGGRQRAMGWRETVEIHEDRKMVTKVVDGKETEVEKTWLYYEMGPYQYVTYDQLHVEMHDYGRGMVKMGLQPGGEDRLHIFGATSHRWMRTFLAAQSQAITVVTAYDTLGESGLIYSLQQTGSKAIFVDNNLLEKLVKPVQEIPDLKYVIHADPLDPEDKRYGGRMYSDAQKAIDRMKEVRPDIEVYSMDEVVELGSLCRDSIFVHRPRKKDLACIMYTSGSTGDPKGVSLTHANIVAGIGGVSVVINRAIVKPDDRVIAFLPLAHIFELVFELTCLYWGALIGYGSVKTLSEASVRNCKGDMKEFRPSVMVGVAAVWEGVRKAIVAQVTKLPPFKQKIFWAAYHTKLRMKKCHIPGGDLIGSLIFKKVRETTGGNLRYILNGGSPLSRDTQVFISNLICPVLIGYGLTETVANGCIVPPHHFKYGVVGDILGSLTVKLVDVEELGYLAKNNQGELWVKGPAVFKDYLQNEAETAAALEDGWFKTGDIAEWTKKGQLRLIDRKKNLVKTLNGEYIALEKLECIYRSNKYVANICVYADQTKVKPIAIVVPNVNAVTDLAISLGLIKDGCEVRDVYDSKKLKKVILDDMHKTAKGQGLGGIELILGFVIFDDEWTPQNGYVTSAQKLQRRKILSAVQSEVDALYAANS